jgi:starvation-inducible DNA-binding protein
VDSKFVPDLGSQSMESLSDVLQDTLMDLLAFGLILKQAHWNVQGPFFRSLHEQFDEIRSLIDTHVDLVAERLTALGMSPNGQASDISYSNIAEIDKGFLRDKAVLTAIVERTSQLARNLRERTEIIKNLDSPTEDLMHSIEIEIEKQLWMLRSQI